MYSKMRDARQENTLMLIIRKIKIIRKNKEKKKKALTAY